MTNFATLVKERRSANLFLPGYEISDAELNDMLGLVKYAPSAFNLQHAHYVAVRDPELKDELYEAANKQYKVKSASAVIVVLGKVDAHKDAGRIYEGMLHLGIYNKQEYDYEVASVQQFYESRGQAFMKEEAIRNANLSAMLFMLAAKDKGWDTCPMIGFDPDRVRRALHIPEQYEPALLIALGKEDTSKQRLRGYRKPLGEYVTYEQFRAKELSVSGA